MLFPTFHLYVFPVVEPEVELVKSIAEPKHIVSETFVKLGLIAFRIVIVFETESMHDAAVIEINVIVYVPEVLLIELGEVLAVVVSNAV